MSETNFMTSLSTKIQFSILLRSDSNLFPDPKGIIWDSLAQPEIDLVAISGKFGLY